MGPYSRTLLGALLGLVVGSSVCYWLYKRLLRSEPSKPGSSTEDGAEAPQDRDEKDSRSLTWTPEATGGLLRRVSGMTLVTKVREKPTDVLINPSSNLDAQHLQRVIELLEATEESSVRKQALITLSNSAAFSVNQDLIRNLGGLPVIGNMLSDPVPEVQAQALNALNNLSMNLRNQEQLKIYIEHICAAVEVAPLNSDLQLAALRVLTNMSVTNEYQDMMVNSLPCFLRLWSHGNEKTQIHVLKVLVNLSANPSLTTDLLSTQAPSSLASFFHTCTNDDILLRALTFVANLNENMDSGAAHRQYHENSLFSLLFGDLRQSLFVSLLQHQDEEVKKQIARIVTKQQT